MPRSIPKIRGQEKDVSARPLSTPLSYEHMRFFERDGVIRASFHRLLEIELPRERLEALGLVGVSSEALLFSAPLKKIQGKFELILSECMGKMRNSLTGRRALFIHRQSGIPLLGSNEFGVVDRGSNIIEMKPLTGCNLKCVFCSVHEGRDDETRGWTDYYVEEEYLVQEAAKLAKLKHHPVEINIGPQGEPTLYPELAQLIRDLKGIPGVEVISINTNGVLLTPALIDKLVEAGLTRINLSVHALDQDKAQALMGAPYNLKHILEIIEYAKTKVAILLAPVMVPGMNEDEIPKIIELSKTISSESQKHGAQPRYPVIGVQNFLNYKHGRNPVKAKPMEEFFKELGELERTTGAKLLLKTGENPFSIYPEESPPKPFRKGDIVEGVVACPGRHDGEAIVVCGARVITVMDSDIQVGKRVRVEVVRDKHNIFKGILAGKGKSAGKDKPVRANKHGRQKPGMKGKRENWHEDEM